MNRFLRHIARVLAGVLLVMLCLPALGADWQQYMRDPGHTGSAQDEELKLPLGLAMQVKLDDAVTTAPAIVGGRAYVVDQMGTAYCIDKAGKIVWKTAPDGKQAKGANTSSPCLFQGRVYYGTTAGWFHILNAETGAIVTRIKVGSPIISSPTQANGSIYFQAMDAVVRCLDPDGNERWNWDHYARYKEPAETTKATEKERGHPGSYALPHYGGGEVAVAGKKLVTSFGWDIACLEDGGKEAVFQWCNRAPNGRDGAAPMSSSISGEWVYNAGMGADGVQALTRLSLNNGKVAGETGRKDAYPWNTPAVQGELTAYRDSQDGRSGIVLFDFASRKSLSSWRDEKSATAFVSAQTFTKNHLVATTLNGEVVVLDLQPKLNAKPFRFRTPHGLALGTPAVVDGNIYFGCDDGYFYVLASDGNLQPKVEDQLTLHERRERVESVGGKSYSWPTTHGNAANTSFVDDPGMNPQLRVRWACRVFGHFKTSCIATEEDVVSITLSGLIMCQEQGTGRIRWRRRLPGPEWGSSAGLLAVDGKLFVPRPTYGRMEGTFACLDMQTGKTLWTADIGGRYIWECSSAVAACGKVAFGYGEKGTPPATVIQAWDSATGKPAWKVELKVSGNRAGSIAGCTDGKVMYFTAGAEKWQWKQEGEKERGEFVAVDAETGKVLRRSTEVFGTSYPLLVKDRLLLNEHGADWKCVNAHDGKLLWKRTSSGYTHCSVGEDFLVLRGYGGHGIKLKLEDGKDYPDCKELGGETHSCSAVALTPKLSFAATVGGLNVRDVKTGKLLWQSPGFAPRGCVNPALANGRVFWPSGASGMLFCWE